jgi:hypothetical protein
MIATLKALKMDDIWILIAIGQLIGVVLQIIGFVMIHKEKADNE